MVHSILVSLISVFVVQQQESVVPNQEIVLHFNSEAISTEDVQCSISLLTNQLTDAGVVDIKTVIQPGGGYKISYHSDLSVTSIKNRIDVEAFTDFVNEQSPFSDLPVQDDEVVLLMDVYDIHQDTGGFADTDNALLFEIKQDYHRGSQVSHPFLPRELHSRLDLVFIDTIKEANNVLGLAIANRPYAVPAVRAGPPIFLSRELFFQS
nr:hypothetical protein [Nonlabens ulvanivorans]